MASHVVGLGVEDCSVAEDADADSAKLDGDDADAADVGDEGLDVADAQVDCRELRSR